MGLNSRFHRSCQEGTAGPGWPAALHASSTQGWQQCARWGLAKRSCHSANLVCRMSETMTSGLCQAVPNERPATVASGNLEQIPRAGKGGPGTNAAGKSICSGQDAACSCLRGLEAVSQDQGSGDGLRRLLAVPRSSRVECRIKHRNGSNRDTNKVAQALGT